MGLVRGEDVILSALISQEGTQVAVPFGCARSVTFDISTDFIETSGIDSGNFKTFLPSGKQFSGNIEGLVFLDRPSNNEVDATASWDSSEFADSFPTLDVSALILVTDPNLGSLPICDFSNLSFTTLNDFLNYIVTLINLSLYSATLSGTIITVTARPGLGATINGNPINITYIFTGGSIILPTVFFSGGVTSYNTTKINLGWMYEKIVSGEKIFLKYYETDDDNHFLQKLCEVYIESINETASFDNMVTFTASFKGNGGPTITYGEI